MPFRFLPLSSKGGVSFKNFSFSNVDAFNIDFYCMCISRNRVLIVIVPTNVDFG
jgi:hypothetical protein